MGVDYRALLYVGKEFADQHEAKDWYEKFVDISKEDQDYINQESFSEYLYGESEIGGEILNAYSGYGFVLGIDLSGLVRKPELFACEVAKAIETWKKTFGEEPYSIIHTVKVY